MGFIDLEKAYYYWNYLAGGTLKVLYQRSLVKLNVQQEPTALKYTNTAMPLNCGEEKAYDKVNREAL